MSRKQVTKIARLGIGEKPFKKGNGYLTLHYNSSFETLGEISDAKAAKACYSKLTEDKIGAVEAIGMDMNSAFTKVT